MHSIKSKWNKSSRMERKRRVLCLIYICLLARCNKTASQFKEREILLTGSSGELYSPGYPEYFLGGVQLTWQITVAENRIIHLKFESFDVGNVNSCYSDVDRSSVEVRDGELNGASLGTFCGSSKPARVSSSGEKLWVRYKSSKYRSTKFKATFTTQKESSASVLLITGLVTSIGMFLCILLTIYFLRRRSRITNKDSSHDHSLTNVQPHSNAHGPCDNTAGNRSCRLSDSAMHSVSFELSEVETTAGNSDLFEKSIGEFGENKTFFVTNDSSKELTPVG